MGRVQAGCCCDGWGADLLPEQSRRGPTTQRIPSCSLLNRCTLGEAAAGSGTEGRGQVRTERSDRVALAPEMEEVGTTEGRKEEENI